MEAVITHMYLATVFRKHTRHEFVLVWHSAFCMFTLCFFSLSMRSMSKTALIGGI